jgi:hypothetical protein
MKQVKLFALTSLIFFFLFGFLYIEASKAAVFKAPVPACRDKNEAQQLFLAPEVKKKNNDSLTAQAQSNACSKFTAGQKVTVDERDGQLWCVRPSGELECYWTIDKAINVFDLGKGESDQNERKK